MISPISPAIESCYVSNLVECQCSSSPFPIHIHIEYPLLRRPRVPASPFVRTANPSLCSISFHFTLTIMSSAGNRGIFSNNQGSSNWKLGSGSGGNRTDDAPVASNDGSAAQRRRVSPSFFVYESSCQLFYMVSLKHSLLSLLCRSTLI